jgi:hypothetical protein
MLDACKPSIRQLIAYKRYRDQTCLRKSAAHNTLDKKLRSTNSKTSYLRSRIEASIFSLLIDRLILDDLEG